MLVLSTFILAGFRAADAESPRPLSERVPLRGAGGTRSLSDCIGACLRYKRLAAKRLRMAGWFEQKRNDWRAIAKRGDARSSGTGVSGGRALPVPHLSAWLCIHKYEGPWNDAGDPYWGGLQMDRQFMSTYAPRWLLAKGWANSWTPREQMWVAERAWRVRGFAPWPNTAAICGL